jgi:hypothetical protein
LEAIGGQNTHYMSKFIWSNEFENAISACTNETVGLNFFTFLASLLLLLFHHISACLAVRLNAWASFEVANLMIGHLTKRAASHFEVGLGQVADGALDACHFLFDNRVSLFCHLMLFFTAILLL